jgi:hypothetical protein
MLRFVKETWLPTVLFAGPTVLTATADRDKGVIHYAAPVTALIVVPLVWKSFVIRRGRPRVRRAVLAGSASAFMILWSEEMIGVVRHFIHPAKHGSEGLGGLLVIFIPFITLIGLILGAGVASLAAFVQARLLPDPPVEPGTADPMLDGAVGGALVGTLVAPFAAIPLAGLMLDRLTPTMNLITLTAGTWLVLVSAGAWLGVKAVRRYRRITASAEATAPMNVS